MQSYAIIGGIGVSGDQNVSMWVHCPICNGKTRTKVYADKDTLALNTLKALRDAPISMGRGEIPVELRQQPSVMLFYVSMFL